MQGILNAGDVDPSTSPGEVVAVVQSLKRRIEDMKAYYRARGFPRVEVEISADYTVKGYDNPSGTFKEVELGSV